MIFAQQAMKWQKKITYISIEGGTWTISWDWNIIDAYDGDLFGP